MREEKPPENASVLELEEFEKNKNRIKVNIYNRPAVIGFVYGIICILASLLQMIWNVFRPIIRYGFMPGFEGWFYGYNVYRVVSGYLLIAAIVFLCMWTLKLYKESKPCDSRFFGIRNTMKALALASLCVQPVSFAFVTVQAIKYFA